MEQRDHPDHDTLEHEPEEEYPQPAQEVVDPRDPRPEPDAPDVKIAGPRDPRER